MRLPILTAVAAVALLAGCSSAAAKPATPAPSSSPTATTATITQYASYMNGPLKSYRETWQKYQDDCLIPPSAAICGIELLTLNLTAKTVSTAVHVLEDRDSHGYVGPPPAELVTLVTDTLTAAGTVAAETEDGDHLPDGWARDAIDLDSIVDRWGPYLGG